MFCYVGEIVNLVVGIVVMIFLLCVIVGVVVVLFVVGNVVVEVYIDFLSVEFFDDGIEDLYILKIRIFKNDLNGEFG